MSRTVLVVDDDPAILKLLEGTLEDLDDVEILKATNGTDAIAAARAGHPKVVVLDVMMPGMNGFEVCEVLRGDKALRGMKVVIVTASGQDFDRATGAIVGADRYVTKPFEPDELLQIVQELLVSP